MVQEVLNEEDRAGVRRLISPPAARGLAYTFAQQTEDLHTRACAYGAAPLPCADCWPACQVQCCSTQPGMECAPFVSHTSVSGHTHSKGVVSWTPHPDAHPSPLMWRGRQPRAAACQLPRAQAMPTLSAATPEAHVRAGRLIWGGLNPVQYAVTIVRLGPGPALRHVTAEVEARCCGAQGQPQPCSPEIREALQAQLATILPWARRCLDLARHNIVGGA